MKLEEGMHDAGGYTSQIRCLHPTSGMLIGLISNVATGQWRIEMFMRVDGLASTREEAIAFAKGCWAMAVAHNMYPRNQPGSGVTLDAKETKVK